jgi:hypothetical protein
MSQKAQGARKVPVKRVQTLHETTQNNAETAEGGSRHGYHDATQGELWAKVIEDIRLRRILENTKIGWLRDGIERPM